MSGLAVPLQLLLGLFFIFLLIYIVYSGLILHQLIRFAVMGPAMPLVLALFLLGTIVLLAWSGTILSPYDWNAVLPLDQLLQPNAALFPSGESL
jgi:hypothetical protein